LVEAYGLAGATVVVREGDLLMGRNLLGAAGLSMFGYSLLRLARHSSNPPVMWLGATTSFIGAFSLLRRGMRRDNDHEVTVDRVEVVS
jgi:hypothetical protein